MQCQNNMQYNNAQKRIICKCVGKKYKIEDYKMKEMFATCFY